LLAAGLCGIILFAMLFSAQPTVKINLQILMLNPLALVFLYPTINKLRKKKMHPWLFVWMTFIVLFLLGGFFQSYAEGMYIVASSLLIRYLLKMDQSVRNKK